MQPAPGLLEGPGSASLRVVPCEPDDPFPALERHLKDLRERLEDTLTQRDRLVKEMAEKTPGLAVTQGVPVRFEITVSETTFCYIFLLASSGKLRVIFPTKRYAFIKDFIQVDKDQTKEVSVPPKEHTGENPYVFGGPNTPNIDVDRFYLVASNKSLNAKEFKTRELPPLTLPALMKWFETMVIASGARATVTETVIFDVAPIPVPAATPVDVPAATPVDREGARNKLWNLATKFCKEWPWNEQLKDAPIGTRNVLAAFYLLEMLREADSGVFPVDRSWFHYPGRFAALYIFPGPLGSKMTLSEGATRRLASMPEGNDLVKTFESGSTAQVWADRVNADCASATEQKIKSIVTADDVKEAQLVLLAAEVVKGTWLEKFDKQFTKSAVFHTTSGGKGVCRMMSLRPAPGSRCRYWKGRCCQAVLLPTDPPASETTFIHAVVVLPDHASDANTMQDAVVEIGSSLGELQQCVEKEEDPLSSSVELLMPRVNLRLEPVDVKEECSKILPLAGVEVVDESGSKLTLPVSAVSTAAVLEMSEEGFEAASATAMVATRSLDGPPPREPRKITVECDRGFLVYLVDLGSLPQVLYFARVESEKGLSVS